MAFPLFQFVPDASCPGSVTFAASRQVLNPLGSEELFLMLTGTSRVGVQRTGGQELFYLVRVWEGSIMIAISTVKGLFRRVGFQHFLQKVSLCSSQVGSYCLVRSEPGRYLGFSITRF